MRDRSTQSSLLLTGPMMSRVRRKVYRAGIAQECCACRSDKPRNIFGRSPGFVPYLLLVPCRFSPCRDSLMEDKTLLPVIHGKFTMVFVGGSGRIGIVIKDFFVILRAGHHPAEDPLSDA